MTVDFASEIERKFFADNLLLSEDWENEGIGQFPDDLSQLLDAESAMHVGDLPVDLEIPMLDDADGLDLSSAALSDPWKDLSDGSDSGLDCGSTHIGIKDEPLSPASSHESDSTDSLSSQYCLEAQMTFPQQQLVLPPEVKLESPPLTPPREQDMCFSPLTSINVTTPFAQNITTVPLEPGAKLPISRIANNKVLIQPKPTTRLQPKAALQSSVEKPLVLTPEQFAKLTAQGVLKFDPPSKPITSSCAGTVVSPTISTATLPITPGPAPTRQTAVQALSFKNQLSLHNSDVDCKTLKRQQRMIKNRESACLSRKRKKEYMSGLEKRLQDFSLENDKLRQENTNLRKKIQLLNSENERLRGGGQMKKMTAVFAVMLLLSLNLGSFSGIFMERNSIGGQINPDSVHHGRTLLAAANEKSKEEQMDFFRHADFEKAQSTLERLKKSMEAWTTQDTGSNSRDLMLFNKGRDSMCPTFLNTTESQRLVNELTGWVLGHKAEQQQQAEEHQKHQQQILQEQKIQKQRSEKKYRRKSPAYRPPKVPPSGANLQQYQHEKSAPYEVQVFRASDSYADFFDAIHRRNDTFYVVSFRRDHLLLPATIHNKTARPRMSLVMPAVALNDTIHPEAGNIAMMQIDCEVMATRLVEVSKASVPPYVSENLTDHSSEPPLVPPQPNRSGRHKRSGNL